MSDEVAVVGTQAVNRRLGLPLKFVALSLATAELTGHLVRQLPDMGEGAFEVHCNLSFKMA